MCYYVIGDCMKKNYIRLNNNDNHLSLGNFFRIIKEEAKNKNDAMQSDLFCIIFDIDYINDTTVNNYCVGYRSIGSDYKQIFLNKKKRYNKNKDEFINTILNILNIIDGTIYDNYSINFINNNKSAKTIANKLYNFAKNDSYVNNDFTKMLNSYIKNNDIYNCLVYEILFIILEKKQPIYENELKKEVLDNILSDTSISSKDLEEYLNLKLREGINYYHSLKLLAEKGNAYANFELGCDEYYGHIMNTPRYSKAYYYLEKAATLDHPSANYMLGNMFVNGLIGNKSNDELKLGYEYLTKAYDLGNVAASNLIGNMYLNGIYPLKKDINKAITYYKKSAFANYVFSYNNLGKIEENKGNYDKAFEYYLKSANLGESWASNKIGEYYRKGIIKKDMSLAYTYYNKALDANYNTLCYYAYYNIAVYFLKNGYKQIEKDTNKMIEYLEIASKNNIIDASIELFIYYYKLYIKENNNVYKNKIFYYKNIIECNEKFNDNIKEKIENIMDEIISKKEIIIKNR